MRSFFLTTSVLAACFIASTNAGPIRGARSLSPDASNKKGKKDDKDNKDRELTFAPLVPGLFSLQVAFLSPDQEIPVPADVETTGNIQVAFDEDFEHLAYALYVDIGKDSGVEIIQAHFHCGSAGINGPVFAFIYDSSKDSEVPDKDGILKIEGILSNDDLVKDADGKLFEKNSLCGKPVNTIASVYELIEARKVYINVHSVKNAGGEIRGQVFMKPKYYD
jgi:hypothetical protein